MEKENNLVIKLNESTNELFEEMLKIKNEFNLKRINSIILLKAFLEEKNSILYDFLCATSNGKNNPYKQIIKDCEEALKEMSQKEKEVSKDEVPFAIMQEDGESVVYTYLTQEFRKIFSRTINFLIEDFKEESPDEPLEDIYVDSEDIFLEFINDIPKDVLVILKNNGVYIEAIMEFYELLCEIYENNTVNVSDNDPEKIPKTISDFVTVLSSKYKGMSECEILERDKEVTEVMRILQKRGRKNAILIGEAGVGKSAVAEKIAFDIANGNCPEELKNHIVLQLSVTASIAGTEYRGMAEERFKFLIEFLEQNENVILFIDEIHMVIGAGASSSNKEMDMANALKPFLANPKAKVIGATTVAEYEKIISSDSAFKRRFKKVIIKEPTSKQVYPMLKNAIKNHENFHGVKISEEMVKYAILISSCFNNTTCNPDRTNDLIDSAMVIAKEQGKKEVDRECILENFEIDFDKYQKLPIEAKKATAYHEAGHYLVWRLTANVQNDLKAIAISIMPTNSYMGVTVYDDISDEFEAYRNKNYYMTCLARMLGGRVAERLYTNDISSGAAEDLSQANKLAYEMVCEYGLGNNQYLTYSESSKYNMISEDIRNKINSEKDIILNQASQYAEELLKKYSDLLKILVEALLDKGILDEDDLEKLFDDYI